MPYALSCATNKLGMYKIIIGRLRMLGSDGLFTLMLSNLILLGCLGITLIPFARKVYRTAKTAPATSGASRLLVVLGARLENDQITTLFRQRLDRTLAIYDPERPTCIIILGGITWGNRSSEAERGREYLLERGINSDDLLVEDQSLNTLENLKHAQPLIARHGGHPVLISNRFHLARCSALARGIGIEHGLCAAEGAFLLSFSVARRLLSEAYYLHWYEVGKRWSRWTRNKKSLARIS